jgi:hypothetical protein
MKTVSRRDFMLTFGLVSITSQAVFAQSALPAHYRLRFLDKKRTVWVLIGDDPIRMKIIGDLEYEFSGQNRFYTYAFAGTGVIEADHFRIEVNDKDIIVNGQKLGEHTNALIYLDGRIEIGVGIRRSI